MRMSEKTKIGTRALLSLALISIAGCGGGGSGTAASSQSNGTIGGTPAPAPTPAPPPPVATAEGLYLGTTSNARTVIGVVLETGSYWVLYSSPNNPTVIAGAVQGTGNSVGGSFSSANARDFNLEGQGINNATVSASYVAKQSLNGVVTYTNTIPTISFTANYSNVYEIVPSVAAIAGTYSGSAAVVSGTEAANVTISTSGALVGRGASGCQFTGVVSPHAIGNIYDVSVTFSGGVCANGTNTVVGIGYFDSASKRLYSAALNSARSNGFIFVGTKP